MFYRADTYGPGIDSLDVILRDATPAQLRALALYHEHQARRLHLAAKAVQREGDDRISMAMTVEVQKRAFLCVGARVALLMNRGLRARAALESMREHTGWTSNVLRAALAAWRRERGKGLGMGNSRFRHPGRSGPGRSEDPQSHR